MREIKFRAWDGDSETFFYSDKPEDERFFEFDNGKLTAFILVETHGTINEPPGMKAIPLDSIDQYTGLKDKNGKEIYEGDIIKDIDAKLSEVYWLEEGATFTFLNVKNHDDWWCPNGYAVSRYEIIGNIYENPELLK